MLNWIQNRRKYLSFFISSLVIIVITGIISPIISNFIIMDKEIYFKEKISELEKSTQEFVSKTELRLTNKLNEIIDITKLNSFSDSLSKKKLFEIVANKEFDNIGVGIYNNIGELIIWNNCHPFSENQFKNLQVTTNNESGFFYNSSLKVYLTLLSSIDKHTILLSIPIEKNYKLRNEYFDPLSLKNDMSVEYNVDLEIVYQNNIASEDQESQKFSFDIKNNSGKKIGYAYINKINIDENIENYENVIVIIQSFFTLLAFIFLGLWLFSSLKQYKYKSIQISFTFLYILFFRVIIFLLDIPDKLGLTELNNPIYFSSTFGFGIVKSPIELFLTIISLVIILIFVFKFIVLKEIWKESKRNIPFAVVQILVIIFLYFFVLRIFGSVLNSVVFDSTILYFKETLLFSDLPTTFMYLNVLLIGVGSVLLSTILTLIAFRILNKIFIEDKIKKIVISIIIFQIAGIVFDLIQPNPQTSWFIRIIFIFITVIISYYIEFTKTSKYSILLAVLFSGSFLSISLLSYFNSDLERKSLKTIATEMSRSSINLLDYYSDEIIYKIADDNSIKQKLLKKDINFNAEAFVIWSNSALSKDSKSSIINIISPDKTRLGGFNYEFNEPYIWDWNDDKSDLEEIQKVYQIIEGTDNQVIRTITPIKHGHEILGYIEVSLLYDVYGYVFDESEKFLSSASPVTNISVNRDLLKIFEFRNNELINYFTDVLISEPETKKLLQTKFSENNEAWINLKVDNEDHTFYMIRHTNSDVEDVIAVGLRDKDVTWNLYDFFKVLFIHSILIVFFLLLITIIKFPKKSELKVSFKTKILIALLLVSILPLILLATYFKEITEEKNSAAVYYKLGKRADNISHYLNDYYINSTLNEKAIFDKAVNDLGINFSIYDKENLLYSSEGVYNSIGLLPQYLNSDVYLNIFYRGEKEFVVLESIETYSFNSFYHKTIFGDKTYVINVSDAFNRIQLPMTGAELNIFLFGTYSLAIILIILLSTLLANQISSPIEKLTKATKSVGSGDMDIQLESFGKGEIKELIDGFNRMVRELKKNQVELAEVERESAWKEMAKQVAHEIKNPLTPMKLTMQHLISAYNDKSNKFDEIFKKVTSTVITQIDNLTNIASEFSSFAKMPTIKLIDVEIIEILKETVDLFIEENCGLKIIADLDKVIVKSDKEQFQRMVINLIRNSIQADALHVWISLNQLSDEVEISIKDDGRGIPEEIVTKIFDENYTTKKEGMGLGLSLAKRFITISGGTIIINETSSSGTEIVIRIPQN